MTIPNQTLSKFIFKKKPVSNIYLSHRYAVFSGNEYKIKIFINFKMIFAIYYNVNVNYYLYFKAISMV